MVSSRTQTWNEEHDQTDNVLRSFKEWLVQEAQAGRVELHRDGSLARPDDTTGKEFHFSPSIAASEPSTDLNGRQANFQTGRISGNRPSVGRRVFRTVACGGIIVTIVSAALAWPPSDDQVRDWAQSLSWLSSALGSKSSPGSDMAAESVSKPSDQAPTQDNAHLQAEPATHSVQASVSVRPNPELQHQIEILTGDLAVVRGIVEKLAAKQEQMAQDIATLQATKQSKQNVSQKITSLPHPSSSHPPPQNNAPKIVHSGAVAQPAQVPRPVPAPPPGKPLPLH